MSLFNQVGLHKEKILERQTPGGDGKIKLGKYLKKYEKYENRIE